MTDPVPLPPRKDPEPTAAGRHLTPVRDAERTRAEIVSVARREFAEHGYSGARVDEIAHRTRTTKRMIYYYFGSKEGLYVAALEDAYAGARRAEQALQIDDLDPVAAIRALAAATYDHHLAHVDFVRLVAIENIHRAEHLRKATAVERLAEPALAQITDVLERGRAAGVFTADVDAVDVHAAISAYCVFPVANGHTFGHLFGRDLRDPARAEHARRMLGDMLVGLLTPRPDNP